MFAAHILCAAAQLERRMIGQRTKEGLAAAKAKGVHVGRPPGVSDALCERIVEMRGDGMTLVAIAERLTAEKALTARRHPMVAVDRELDAQSVRSRATVSLADIRARQATSCSCAAVVRSSLACSNSSRNVSSVTVTVSPSSGETTSKSSSRWLIPA
jgi:hypothetical protein